MNGQVGDETLETTERLKECCSRIMAWRKRLKLYSDGRIQIGFVKIKNDFAVTNYFESQTNNEENERSF